MKKKETKKEMMEAVKLQDRRKAIKEIEHAITLVRCGVFES